MAFKMISQVVNGVKGGVVGSLKGSARNPAKRRNIETVTVIFTHIEPLYRLG